MEMAVAEITAVKQSFEEPSSFWGKINIQCFLKAAKKILGMGSMPLQTYFQQKKIAEKVSAS